MVDDRSVIRWTAAQVARAVMPWTIGHVPTITLPVFRGPSGMPVGLQVLARRFHDRRLFALAQRVYEMLT
jgi:Asp-tRNA(Asn)/Glu-tRNA(Gln) amidotransferase A subunit family amidase